LPVVRQNLPAAQKKKREPEDKHKGGKQNPTNFNAQKCGQRLNGKMVAHGAEVPAAKPLRGKRTSNGGGGQKNISKANVSPGSWGSVEGQLCVGGTPQEGLRGEKKKPKGGPQTL